VPGRLGILAGGFDLPAITVEPLCGEGNEVAPNGGCDERTIAPELNETVKAHTEALSHGSCMCGGVCYVIIRREYARVLGS
jgi:hypothetical protein